jgi:hypothetical protein
MVEVVVKSLDHAVRMMVSGMSSSGGGSSDIRVSCNCGGGGGENISCSGMRMC